MKTLSSRYREISEILRIIFFNKYNKLFLILLIFSFVLRLHFRSNYLDDWDSIQFVMGLQDYSIPAHQPHPPGYPLYIFIGRIFNLFIGDSLLSFTLISAFFGSLVLIPTYLISKNIFDEQVGLLSAVLLSFAPAQVLFSEVVMTDIVSLFFVTFTAYILYRGIKSAQYLYFGSLMVGITAGIRMTDIIIITLLLVISIYVRNIKKAMISGILVLVGICLWLIPIILDTGLNMFLSVQRSQWGSASSASTLSYFGGLSPINLLLTLNVWINLLIEGWSASIIVFIFVLLGFIVINLKRDLTNNNPIIRIGTVFILSWLVTYVLFSIFFNMLYIPRYLLPQFPPLAIIFACVIIKSITIQRGRWAKTGLLSLSLISIIFMGSQAISVAYAINTTSPAPVSASYFIKEHYSTDNIVVISSESFRHFQYYLPDYDVRKSDSTIINEVFNENKTIISEYPIIFYGSETINVSKRDRNIYPKHNYVKLYETKLDIPMNPIVITGWHNLEDWGGVPTRWMENDATLMIYADKNCTVGLNFNILSFYRPRILEMYVNDHLLKRVEITSERVTTVNLPIIELKEGENLVRLHVPEGCERPSNIPELNNRDPRCLSLAIQDLKIIEDILINDNGSSSTSLGDGWHDLEDWGGVPTRWLKNDAIIMIYSDENHTSDLSFKAYSFYRPRTLEIFVNEFPHIRAEVPSDGFVMVNVSSISLNEGANIVRFHVPEGCERPCGISDLNNEDPRCLSMAVQDVRIIGQ